MTPSQSLQYQRSAVLELLIELEGRFVEKGVHLFPVPSFYSVIDSMSADQLRIVRLTLESVRLERV